MKQIICILTVYLSIITAHGQILNGSFENGSNADLANWEWTCGAISYNNAPIAGGNWCIKVHGGNTQGCFPGYAFQKIPAITNGQTYVLSGWALAQTSSPIGLFFGKIYNGVITLQEGDTTKSSSWTKLEIQSNISLSAGDTALVVLYGGLEGGPVQGYGYFDLINLQPVTGINSLEFTQSVKLFPNPFSNQTIIQIDSPLHTATLSVDNIFGQRVKQIENISGQTVVISRDNLACGLYILRLSEFNQVIFTNKMVITD